MGAKGEVIKDKRDFHIHATFHRIGERKSDLTVESVLHRCESLELSMVGVGEHLNNSPKHPESCIRSLVHEFKSLNPNIEAYVFAEADILDRDGTVTCSSEKKRELGLDYLLGAFHTGTWRSSDRNFQAFVEEEFFRLMSMVRRCPQIDVIAHPWRAGFKWELDGKIPRWSFGLVPEDYQDQLIEAARKYNKGIEINLKNTPLDESYIRFVGKLRDAGIPMAIGSDAHEKGAIDFSLEIISFLGKLGVEDDELWSPIGFSGKSRGFE